MPTFVPSHDSPYIPDELVQALEEDRVVLFCGAGISMGAGAPNFSQLVEHCYRQLGRPLPADGAPEWTWPDRMLGALEAQTSSEQVRRTVAQRLGRRPADLRLHRAILRLAELRRTDGLRLVTTNFDRYFESARPRMRLGRDFHSAPTLPIPRNDLSASWRSIVYLHGRLEPASARNRHLVLTSADFGQAYLTDGWAGRFVARLFADFTVLFIGYSLNDPVLRYMTDAFAAERSATRTGAIRDPAYIFVGEDPANFDEAPWRERELRPIFYDQRDDHILLRETLEGWADARDDYLSSSESLISRYAPSDPVSLHPSYADNVVWAVAGRHDPDGFGARQFRSLLPPPPLSWLSEFERRDSLVASQHAEAVAYALAHDQPAPTSPKRYLDELFSLRVDNRNTPLTSTARELANWLALHLQSKTLVDWIINKLQSGRRPHPRLRYIIRHALRHTTLEHGFEVFWRVVSTEADWSFQPYNDFADWDIGDRLIAAPSALDVQGDLFAIMRPRLWLEASLHGAWFAASGGSGDPTSGERFSHVASAEVRLSEENEFRFAVEHAERVPDPDQFWANNLDLTTGALKEVFTIHSFVEEADEQYDPSVVQRPSIEPHPQNAHRAAWAQIYDLIWRGWLVVDGNDPARSRHLIIGWRATPYLGFRRLALAATAASRNFSAAEKLEALLNG